jgi:hypothetical protein
LVILAITTTAAVIPRAVPKAILNALNIVILPLFY